MGPTRTCIYCQDVSPQTDLPIQEYESINELSLDYTKRANFKFKSRKPSFTKSFIPNRCSKPNNFPVVSVDHIHKLFSLFLDPTLHDWIQILLSISRQVCDNLNLDIQNGDQMDIRHYIKIKKIPGGSESDSKFMNGLVFSHKSVHMRFMEPLNDVLLILINFPLEYERFGKYVSMDTLMSQEKDYVRIIISRILSLNATLIISSKTLSPGIIKGLRERGITVLYSVKPSVMTGLSRITGAELLLTFEQFMKPIILGKVKSFKTITFIHPLLPGVWKSFIHINGQLQGNGGTVVLRGPSLENLEKIKLYCGLMSFIYYGIKLETSLLNDFNVSVPKNLDIDPVSLSPYIKYIDIPQQLTHPHTFDGFTFEKIYYNQKLDFLFIDSEKEEHTIRSHYSIGFYSEIDISVGQFIEMQCERFISKSVSFKKFTILTHIKKIDVETRFIPNSVNEKSEILGDGIILTWGKCNICKEIIPTTKLSEDSWKFSFTRLIEMMIYPIPDLVFNEQYCEHSFNSYSRYFQYKHCEIELKILDTTLLRVKLPDIIQSITVQQKYKESLIQQTKSRIHNFYQSLAKTLANLFRILPHDLFKKATNEKISLLQKLQDNSKSMSTKSLVLLNKNYIGWTEELQRAINEYTNSMYFKFGFGYFKSYLMPQSKVEKKIPMPILCVSPPPTIPQYNPKKRREKVPIRIDWSDPFDWTFNLKEEFSTIDWKQVENTIPIEITSHILLALKDPKKTQSRLGDSTEPEKRKSIFDNISWMWGTKETDEIQIDSPLFPNEQVIPDSNIIIRDEEPPTILAHTLSSKDYFQELEYLKTHTPNENSNETELKDFNEDIGPNIHDVLVRGSRAHIVYEFSNSNVKLLCRVLFAQPFEALRKFCHHNEDAFIESLTHTEHYDGSAGKSGSLFLQTLDQKYIIKQLSKVEVESFIDFAGSYFHHLSESMLHSRPTAITKVFGCFRVEYKNYTTKKSYKIDLIVMENLFYGHTITRVFDLKGSLRNRKVENNGRHMQVLLDENLVQLIEKSPFFIGEEDKDIIRGCIDSDTLFLSGLNIMDYSLLVGVDEERMELVAGIVDFIRQFTWDKKLENISKSVLGGKDPTIVSPKLYRDRFRDAIDGYFLMVPSKYGKNHSNLTMKTIREIFE